MWNPCWRCNDRTFLRQWPTSSPALPRPDHQHCARALPLSSSERSCDWERWTWCLLWLHLRERQMEGERERERGGQKETEKKIEEEMSRKTAPISTSHSSTGNNHCLLFAYLWLNGAVKTTYCRQVAKNITDIIWYNGIQHRVGLWNCMSQVYLFIVVSSIKRESFEVWELINTSCVPPLWGSSLSGELSLSSSSIACGFLKRQHSSTYLYSH